MPRATAPEQRFLAVLTVCPAALLAVLAADLASGTARVRCLFGACVAARGHAYAEAAVGPSDSAHMGLASGPPSPLSRGAPIRLVKVAS